MKKESFPLRWPVHPDKQIEMPLPVFSVRARAVRAAGLIVLLCAAGCIRRTHPPQGPDARMEVESDSARGSDFAKLIVPGDTAPMPTLVVSALTPRIPGDLLRTEPASVYVAVIVDSTGWAEPASRTLLGSSGDPRVVKIVCDFLATATFDWHGAKPRRTVAFVPGLFFSSEAPRGQTPTPPTFKNAPTNPDVLAAQLRALTFDERRQWFADQQPCASFRVR